MCEERKYCRHCPVLPGHFIKTGQLTDNFVPTRTQIGQRVFCEQLKMHMPFSLPGLTRQGAPAGSPAVTAKPRTAAETDRSWTLPGLCWNASVMTSFGALPVQVLRKHDPLRLTDGNVARIAWVDKIQLDEEFLRAYPDAQPILIRAGSLGQTLPAQDMQVSPHQKIAVPGLNFRTELRAARDLLGRPGVLRQPQTVLTYYLFHCGQPAQVTCEGLGLYTAP